MDVGVILAMLTAGSAFSWIFRKLRIPDVVGYVLGGVVATAVLIGAGVDVESGSAYIEPLKWLGLTLFSFTVGASIGLHNIAENLHRVVASELVVYVILWLASDLLAQIAGVGYVERTALFIVLVNSSTAATVFLIRNGFGLTTYVRDRVMMQTSMEDLAQFVMFTLMFMTGISLVEDPLRTLIQLLTVVGLSVLIVLIAKRMFTLLGKTKFMADRENKFIVVVGATILFASMASLVGLPPLFGAFLAGLSFSTFFPLNDISDMVNGVKSLGLLLYFTSLGAHLYLVVAGRVDNWSTVSIGVALGAIVFLLRSLSVLLAMLLTGSDLGDSISIAILLAPLSEMGIVFTDILAQRGLIPVELVTGVAVATITSILFFGIATRWLVQRASIVERLAPLRISRFFRYISHLYARRADVAISMLTPMIKFTSIALCLAYVNSLLVSVVEQHGLPLLLVAAFSAVLSVGILVTFILTLRDIFGKLLKYAVLPVSTAGEVLGKMLDIAIGGLAMAVQIYILYVVSLRVLAVEPLYMYVTLTTMLTLVTVTLYEFIKYYSKIGRRKPA